MHEEIEVTLKAAETLLEKKAKIETTIVAGVAELPNLIESQLTTEREFRQLEAQGAVDGAAPAGLPASRKAAETARNTLEQAALRLSGLRANLAGLGGALAEGYDKLAAEIPKHNAAVIAAFKAEWEAALAVWSPMLGRRAAVERVLGQPLTLPDPVAAAANIGDMAKPHEVQAALVAAIDMIAGNMRMVRWQTTEQFFYNPAAVYRIYGDRAEKEGFPNSSLVIDASLSSGRLRQLVALGHAQLATWADGLGGSTIAKSEAIERTRREAELAEEERKLRDRSGDENLKRSGREVVPQYHQDTEKRRRQQEEIDARQPMDSTRGHGTAPTVGYPIQEQK